jgi:hypothetical protein
VRGADAGGLGDVETIIQGADMSKFDAVTAGEYPIREFFS